MSVKRATTGILVVAAAAVGLSACAKNWDPDATAALPTQGDAFSTALHQQFVERARFEEDEADYEAVDYFNSRAALAARGTPPSPLAPSGRTISGQMGMAEAAHDRLISALATDAPARHPQACAKAQAWYEHWLEQLEEGHQADHIAMAKKGYDVAIVNCEVTEPRTPAKTKSEPEPVAMPGPWHVFFPLDDSTLTPAGMKVIKQVVNNAAEHEPKRIVLEGYADRSGGTDYNYGLSVKRLIAVMDVIENGGVNVPMGMKPHGETNLPVATEDGVVEEANRRVTIRFGY